MNVPDPSGMLLHYRLVEKIGQGGMGEVWRAVDTTLDRDVAIKVLPERFASDPERLSRFTREARLLAALNHPSIASIHSVHADGKSHFLVMELVDGTPLRKRIPELGMAADDLLRIAVPLADALAAAHARGITHRDLKPDNVMLTREGRVKVLDFGLAKLAREQAPGEAMTGLETASITGQGRILGTVAYMSPEQAEGKPTDPRSDVFSLGILLYEMATGQRPFQGETPISTLSAILRDTPPQVSRLNGSIPAALDKLIGRCLEKDPSKRYASSEDVRADLAAIAGQMGEPARGAGAFSSGLRVASVLAVVVAAAVTAWILFRPSPEPAAVGGSPGSPAGAPLPAIAIVGFENLTDPTDADRLGRVLMGLITTDLAESGGLDVISTARVLSALRSVGGSSEGGFDLSLAADAASAAGAGLMLVGQVNTDSDRIVLAAELVDVGSGRTTGSIRKEAGSARELFDLAGSIASNVRSHLGVAPAAGSAPFDLAEALTSSPEAYREYAAGEQAFHLLALAEAERRFREAIRLDPEFAMAYYRLALTLGWAGERDAALEVARLGMPHAERLPEHWETIYKALVPYSHADYEQAHEMLTKLEGSGKEIADARYLLGEVLTHATRFWDPRGARRHFERALELDPTFGVSLSHLLDAYRLGDDRRAMRDLLDRMGGPGSSDGNARTVRLKLLWAERRYEELARAVESDPSQPMSSFQRYEYAFSLMRTGEPRRALALYADPSDLAGVAKATFLVGRAFLQMWEGRFLPAIEDLHEAAKTLEDEGLKRELAAVHLALARAHLARGAAPEALLSARRAVEADPLMGGGWYWLGRVALEAGRAADVDAAADGLRRVVAQIRTSEAGYWQELLAAEIALSKDLVEETRAALDRAADRPTEYRHLPAEEDLRARIHAAGGDPDGAIEAYRRILEPPWLLAGEPWVTWFDWPIDEIQVLHSLGELEASAGQIDRARERYREYLDRWGDSDVPIPDVARVRTRLSALR